MPTDLKHALDEKIRKLQLLRELADDPDAIAMLRDLANDGKNVSNGMPEPVTQAPAPFPPSPTIPVWKSAPLPMAANRGKQSPLVEELLRAANRPVRADWLVARMKERGYVFVSTNPRISVTETLRCLHRKGQARIAGKDGMALLWEAVSVRTTDLGLPLAEEIFGTVEKG